MKGCFSGRPIGFNSTNVAVEDDLGPLGFRGAARVVLLGAGGRVPGAATTRLIEVEADAVIAHPSAWRP